MSEDFFSEFLNLFTEAATKKLAQKAADELVNGLFSDTQNSRSIYRGKVEKIWIDQNFEQNNQKGLAIHCKFEVSQLKDAKCLIAAYFYHKDGTPLKDNNDSHTTVDGQVCTAKDFIPPYEETVYKDLTLFMPYDELHLAEGKHELKFCISLYEKSTNSGITRSNDYHFRHNYIDNQPRGTIKKIWVDFDVIEAGKRGMNIHATFQADNLKNTKCQATAFFYSDDGGTHLKDTNKKYCSTTGQVCVSNDFNPAHKNCIYEDFALFMPYGELHLEGEHGLTFRIRLFNQSKQTDIVWSENYYFYHFLDGEITIGEEEVIDTMSMLQVLIARQLGVDALEISSDANLTELFGNSLLKSRKLIGVIEKNLNIKFDHNDPEEINIFEELNTLEEVTLFIVFKRKLPQLIQNSDSVSTESEKVTTSCPKCSQKLRYPSNRGKLTLTCPKCKHSWQYFQMESFTTYKEYLMWFDKSKPSSQPLSEEEFYRSVRYQG